MLARTNGAAVGIAGFSRTEDAVVTGYSVYPALRRIGLATEGLQALVAWLFERPRWSGYGRPYRRTTHARCASRRSWGWSSSAAVRARRSDRCLSTIRSGPVLVLVLVLVSPQRRHSARA